VAPRARADGERYAVFTDGDQVRMVLAIDRIDDSDHRSNVPVNVPFAIAPSRTAVSASPVPVPSSAASCLPSAYTVKR
jgi:hypothetical protein